MPLPALRQELALYPAPPSDDGSPAWHLHDPAANRYYLVGWPAFEILSRWPLDDAAAIVAAIAAQTTLSVSHDDIESLLMFLEQHHLLAAATARDSERLGQAAAALKLHWAKWLLHNYLFFRIPLVHPDRFLDRFAAHIGVFLRPRFWSGAAALALLSLALVARQWEAFAHTFSAYQGLERILSFGVAMSMAKVCHELGHAFVARHHGCKVPTMGVAFLVMWPVLYTDTNEAWKLPSRRARFQIGVAGIATELLLAVLATLAWVFLPEGSARGAAFFLATTSWVLTLAINVSPFMRFDGYFLLSDAVGVPNLHHRAFAFGRWWLREKLFALGADAPENVTLKRQRLLVAFAFATWIYRLSLFLGIAFLVYHAVFKLLGIVLMLVEIGWFVVLPFVHEGEAWWKLRHGQGWTPAARRSAVLAALLLLWLLLPLQNEVSAPAVLVPQREQSLYSPLPAIIIDEPARGKQTVRQGDILLRLSSPDLEHRLALARVHEAGRHGEVGQQAFSASLRLQGEALRHHWAETQAQLTGLAEEAGQLLVRAPFDGEILARSQDLAPGAWVTPQDLLYAVADRRQPRVDAYVGEADLERLHRGDAARFVPEAAEFGRQDCTIGEVDRVNVAELQEPALASAYGGPLPVLTTPRNTLVPASTVYRVRLSHCADPLAPKLRLRGTAHLEADGRCLLVGWFRQALRVLIRESGF